MKLSPNMNWMANQNVNLPSVNVELSKSDSHLKIHFSVKEHNDCFALQYDSDNSPCYEDSCVEVFLLATNGDYFNFEFNAKGFCLAAKGPDRHHREKLSFEDLQKIKRSSSISKKENFVFWELFVEIPFSILKMESNAPLKGNLYKCGDKAKTPHYSSLFPIDTEKPDFHRPEFFRELEGEIVLQT